MSRPHRFYFARFNRAAAFFCAQLVLGAELLLSPLVAQEGVPVLPGIDAAMQGFVDRNEMAGSVTLVASRDGLLHLESTGWADLATRRPMQTDAIFAIASMTKPITATAFFILQEQGLVQVTDLVETYLPEFSRLRTPSGALAHITIAQLLTHTSGLNEGQAVTVGTLATVIPTYLAQPTGFEPGTRYAYSSSGINVVARIVEVVSGKSFDVFVNERVCQPLGMVDTTFYPTAEQRRRVASAYRLDPVTQGLTSTLSVHPIDPIGGDHYWPPYGSGGLLSTARDYARFCRMMLNGGELDGRRILQPQTVAWITSIQTGSIPVGSDYGYGYGWRVIREPQGVSAMLSPGTYGHGGSWGTQAWIDPVTETIYILMIQRTGFGSSDTSALRESFQQAATSALGLEGLPTIAIHPTSCTVATGASLALASGLSDRRPATYQWRKDGVAIAGATQETLFLPRVGFGDAGAYTVVAANRDGAVTSTAAMVRAIDAAPSRIANLSVRGIVPRGRPLVVGFATNGPESLLVRAIGPGLAAFGVEGCVADPRLELYTESGAMVATNDNWPATLRDTFVSVGSFPLPPGSNDAALVQSINGPHSAHIKSAESGVVLAEVYETAAGRARLNNLSARQFIGSATESLIAGFIIEGEVAKTLLIRAVGPKLASFGVPDALSDPTLEIVHVASGRRVAANDNWNARLADVMHGTGAFRLDPGSRDAAVLVTLPPGAYTAHLSASTAAAGEALVEIYEVPESTLLPKAAQGR